MSSPKFDPEAKAEARPLPEPLFGQVRYDYRTWHARRVETCLAHLRRHLPAGQQLKCLDLGHDPMMGEGLEALGLQLTGNVHPSAVLPRVRWPLAAFDFEAGIPLPDASFDVVTAFEVIEHIVSTPRPFLREIHRVLRPGGIMYLGTPNVSAWAKIRRQFAHIHPYDALPYSMDFGPRHEMCHVYEYDPWTLKQLVQSEGFLVTEVRTWDVYQSDPSGIRQLALRILITGCLLTTGYLKDAAQLWRLRGHQIGLVARRQPSAAR